MEKLQDGVILTQTKVKLQKRGFLYESFLFLGVFKRPVVLQVNHYPFIEFFIVVFLN